MMAVVGASRTPLLPTASRRTWWCVDVGKRLADGERSVRTTIKYVYENCTWLGFAWHACVRVCICGCVDSSDMTRLVLE